MLSSFLWEEFYFSYALSGTLREGQTFFLRDWFFENLFFVNVTNRIPDQFRSFEFFSSFWPSLLSTVAFLLLENFDHSLSSFHWLTRRRCSFSFYYMIILALIGIERVIKLEIFHGKISLVWVLLLILLNLLSSFKLVLMYISFIKIHK